MDLKRYIMVMDNYPKVDEYDIINLMGDFEIMAERYYLSFYYYNFRFSYGDYRTKRLLDNKGLVKKRLIRNKPKEEVLNGWYFIYLMAK